ncbi:TonB-dependent receptor [Phenylobacterium sp.]|uniref:TonB-dependent receptor n=1 Tax=Phenylobacterium sp. TaxID=1871053 RepID=UPI0025D65994|nr:TonB-dependent receptor [Phenylobacterium sp.]MBX3482390.1 TonB-dependent receptor [Phenylobacterium sp.]MCW5760062.1 TonB-dependent receptor [Phenylobacterium sp.]
MSARSNLLVLLATTSLLGLAAPAMAADADGATIDELVVTAQRREQSLLDVPLSMAVVSADTLKNANIASVTELTQLATGLTYNTNFGGGFQVRGVGTQSVLISSEQSVSVVVDDIVQGLPEIAFAGPSYQALTDIERVEVLRGPQGTLFGKNSSAGVLQIITKKPRLGEYAGDVTASYATDNEVRLNANLNVPIGENAAFKISGFVQRRDGFVHNRFTGEDVSGYSNRGVRAKLLWKPSEKLELYVIGAHIENSDSGNGVWTLRSCGSGLNGTQGRYLPCDEAAKFGVVAGPKNLSGSWDGALGVKQTNDSISARVTYDLGGGAQLKAITGYYEVDVNEDVDVDSSQRPIVSTNISRFIQSQFTQEIRLEGTFNDNIDYTIGGFYYRSENATRAVQGGTYHNLPDGSPITLTTTFGPVRCCLAALDSDTKSLAAFGQVTVRLLDDRLSITGGLRYTDDKVSLQSRALDRANTCQVSFATAGAACKPVASYPSPAVISKNDATDLSGKITVQYEVAADVNVYATYSTGYKGPLISYARGQPLLPVDEETVENYEIGLKGAFLDRRLIATAAAFRSRYTGFQGQTTVVDPLNPAIRSLTTTNAGGLKTKGFELDATFKVTRELTLRGGYAYIPTEFVDFAIQCNDRFTNPATVPGQCTYISEKAPGLLQFNAGGYPLIYAPKNSFNLGLNYERAVMGDHVFGVAVNYNWRDKAYTAAADPNSILPSYGLLGANISFGPEDGQWRVSAFARNLLDKYFVTGIFKTPLDSGTAGSTPLSTIGYANIPSIESSRTLGVKVEVNF